MVYALEFTWAQKRWKDPLSGTDVVCLTPPDATTHWRNNYFRYNMFTDDGRYMIVYEADGIDTENGWETNARLRAIDLRDGSIRDLGLLDDKFDLPFGGVWSLYETTHQAHEVVLLRRIDDGACGFDVVDIDTGERRTISPQVKLPTIWGAGYSYDGRYAITIFPTEKFRLLAEMDPFDWGEMMSVQPGRQDCYRIDLQTGATDSLFNVHEWSAGHPIPHPRDPDLFLCCQGFGAPSKKWGTPKERRRIRPYRYSTGEWLPTGVPDGYWPQAYHEMWCPSSTNIWGHCNSHCFHGANGRFGVDAICRIDPLRGVCDWFPCPPGRGCGWHAHIAPSERFLVGDGNDIAGDDALITELDKRIETIPPSIHRGGWELQAKQWANGAETIWLYEVPEEPLPWDAEAFDRDGAEFRKAMQKHPESVARTTPLAHFRTMWRNEMFPHRLESNAHVTPDNRWCVFQSSSEDGKFQVWAARIPEHLARSQRTGDEES